jgi:hypothetical protein
MELECVARDAALDRASDRVPQLSGVASLPNIPAGLWPVIVTVDLTSGWDGEGIPAPSGVLGVRLDLQQRVCSIQSGFAQAAMQANTTTRTSRV